MTVKAQKKNNMAFKLKSGNKPSPNRFFGKLLKGLGNQLKTNRKDIGGEMKKKNSGKAQRANEVPRPGESEYQFKVRTRRARSKKADKPVTKTPEQLENIDVKSEIKIDPTVGMDRYTYISSSKPKTNKKTFKQAFAEARKAKKKNFNFEGKSYTTKLKEENFKVITGPSGQPVIAEDYEDYGNPITKKTKKTMRKPFKMKAGKAGPMKKNFKGTKFKDKVSAFGKAILHGAKQSDQGINKAIRKYKKLKEEARSSYKK